MNSVTCKDRRSRSDFGLHFTAPLECFRHMRTWRDQTMDQAAFNQLLRDRVHAGASGRTENLIAVWPAGPLLVAHDSDHVVFLREHNILTAPRLSTSLTCANARNVRNRY